MCKSKLLSFHSLKEGDIMLKQKEACCFFFYKEPSWTQIKQRDWLYILGNQMTILFFNYESIIIFFIVSNFSLTLPFFPREHLAFYYVVFSVGNKALFPKSHRGNGLVCPLLFPVNQWENDLGLELKLEFSL